MRFPRIVGVVAAFALAVTFAPGLADACSCLVGSEPKLVVPTVPLPRDARGIVVHGDGAVWSVGRTAPEVRRWEVPPASRFSFERVEGARTVPVPLELWPIVEPSRRSPDERQAHGAVIASREPLLPGRYRIGTGTRFGDLVESPVTVTISEDSMVAGTARLLLGEATRGPLELAAGGSCSATVEAVQRTIRIELPESAKQFAPGLLYMTSVDGKPWRPAKSLCKPTVPGRSWRGDGEELLFTVCGDFMVADEGLAPGVTHTVKMRVHAPGSDVAIETPR